MVAAATPTFIQEAVTAAAGGSGGRIGAIVKGLNDFFLVLQNLR